MGLIVPDDSSPSQPQRLLWEMSSHGDMHLRAVLPPNPLRSASKSDVVCAGPANMATWHVRTCHYTCYKKTQEGPIKFRSIVQFADPICFLSYSAWLCRAWYFTYDNIGIVFQVLLTPAFILPAHMAKGEQCQLPGAGCLGNQQTASP